MRFLMLHTIALALFVTDVPGQTTRRLDPWRAFAASSYVGLGIVDVNSERAEEVGLIEPHGVEITSVAPGSPAESAGLSVGDIVLTYRETRVEGIEHFARLIRETPVGRTVGLGIFRSGAQRKIEVKIGERADNQRRAFGYEVPQIEFSKFLDFDMPKPRIAVKNRALGAEVEAIDGQFAEFFGVNAGILVRSVDDDSAADRAGIRSGDVITSVGGHSVTEPQDIRRRMAASGDDSTEFQIMRDRKSVAVAVEAPDQPSRLTRGRGPTRRVNGPR